MARAFALGCAAHQIRCDVRPLDRPDFKADVVWLYGLGPARERFDSHAGALRLVGDKGYFAEYGPRDYIRVSVNAQQPDLHLQRRKHALDRWVALRINRPPPSRRGDYVLLCGMGPKQATRQGYAYGGWEQQTFDRLRQITDRPILVREKPKNPPIGDLPRSGHRTTAEAIRDAWAVVCMTGNIGVDCIVEGVPVFAQAGPGRVYYPHDLAALETAQPLSRLARHAALADITHWQWRLDEFSSGALWSHLKAEGFL